jgi:hypothetical protein
MHENNLKLVDTVWQSAQVVHRPGECLLPAEIGKYVSWAHVEGCHAVVVWQGWQSVGNPAAR